MKYSWLSFNMNIYTTVKLMYWYCKKNVSSSCTSQCTNIAGKIYQILYKYDFAFNFFQVFCFHVGAINIFFITVHETDGICICKGVILDVAKSLTFPLPLLAVAHQQLILGTDLKTKCISDYIIWCLEAVWFLLIYFTHFLFQGLHMFVEMMTLPP